MAKHNILKYRLLLFVVVLICTACAVIRPYKRLPNTNAYFKPAYLKAEIFYNDTICILSVHAFNKSAPRNHDKFAFLFSKLGVMRVNEDSTMITIANISSNNSNIVLKKCFNGWVMDGAYKIHLKRLEFIPLADSMLNYSVLQKSIAVKDSIFKLPAIKLMPFEYHKGDFIGRGILLSENSRYELTNFGIVLSRGNYSSENGLLILNEDKTGYEFYLKILDTDTMVVRHQTIIYERGGYVSDNIYGSYERRYPVYCKDCKE